MRAKKALMLLMAAGTVAAADGDMHVVQGQRAALAETMGRVDGPVSAYLQRIDSPRRRFKAREVGLASAGEGAGLWVVGPLSRPDLAALLAAERIDRPVWKVVGDARYARVYFGNPRTDPCCYTEWTFAKDAGRWERIYAYSRSH